MNIKEIFSNKNNLKTNLLKAGAVGAGVVALIGGGKAITHEASVNQSPEPAIAAIQSPATFPESTSTTVSIDTTTGTTVSERDFLIKNGSTAEEANRILNLRNNRDTLQQDPRNQTLTTEKNDPHYTQEFIDEHDKKVREGEESMTTSTTIPGSGDMIGAGKDPSPETQVTIPKGEISYDFRQLSAEEVQKLQDTTLSSGVPGKMKVYNGPDGSQTITYYTLDGDPVAIQRSQA